MRQQTMDRLNRKIRKENTNLLTIIKWERRRQEEQNVNKSLTPISHQLSQICSVPIRRTMVCSS